MAEDSAAAPASDRLEPGVRAFVDGVCRAFEARADGRSLSHAEARRIAEETRAPWREGGPAMARTTECVTTGGRAVRLRLHQPAIGGAPRGGVVYMHGGGWTLFSLDTHDRVMREYAARSGLTVIGVDYALSPEARFPEALLDVVHAIEWLSAEAAGLDLDAGRLAAGGDSAGANLALAAALVLRGRPQSPRLKGLLLNYGCYDVAISAEAESAFGGPGFMLTAAEMEAFWSDYLRTPADARDPLACPLLAGLEGLPPAFVAIAECDVLAEQNLAMAERLRAAGVATTAVVYRGASHSFLEAVSVSPLSRRALDEGGAWLRTVCG